MGHHATGFKNKQNFETQSHVLDTHISQLGSNIKKIQDLDPYILQMNIYKALDTHCLLTIHNKYRKALC